MFYALADLIVYQWLGLSADSHAGAALALSVAALVGFDHRKLSA